jgi:hypothetical protein
VYVGSWYGDYDKVGSNWAGPDFDAPYDWLTPEYRKTAYAGLLDWLTTGCYYYPGSMAAAVADDDPPGQTVEGAGLLSSLVVSDAAWTYAGIYALSYEGHPDAFSNALEAAVASSQGAMVFDMSQIIDYNWWPLLANAFEASPAQPPNAVPGLLDQVRQAKAESVAKGLPPPALPPYVGLSGTGW